MSRSDSKKRMLEAAAELFHTKGYHATGLNELVSAGGAPKGSLYFHFPGGKEQLGAEAVLLSGDRIRTQLSATLDDAASPGEAVEAVIEFLAEMLQDSGFERGCPLATVALDAANDSEPIRNACADGYRTWHEVIVDALTCHGHAAADAGRLGTVVLASLEGALLLAKTQRDTAPLHTVATHLRATIEKESPQ